MIDAFVYYDEQDHVATRMAELEGEADAFVAVWSDRTFRGTPRDPPPLDLGDRFWHHQVRLAPPAPGEDDPDFFGREGAQRDGIAEALRALREKLDLSDADVVLVTDADEIPSRGAVRRIRKARGGVELLDARRGTAIKRHMSRTLALTPVSY